MKKLFLFLALPLGEGIRVNDYFLYLKMSMRSSHSKPFIQHCIHSISVNIFNFCKKSSSDSNHDIKLINLNMVKQYQKQIKIFSCNWHHLFLFIPLYFKLN